MLEAQKMANVDKFRQCSQFHVVLRDIKWYHILPSQWVKIPLYIDSKMDTKYVASNQLGVGRKKNENNNIGRHGQI